MTIMITTTTAVMQLLRCYCRLLSIASFGHHHWIWILLLVTVAGRASADEEQLFRIREERPSRFLIHRFPPPSSSSGAGHLYKLLSRSKAVMDLLEIVPTTGELRTRIRIDRDLLCSTRQLCCSVMADCSLNFKVIMIRGDMLEGYMRCRVVVEDINDNKPIFHLLPASSSRDGKAMMTLEVSEAAKVGSQFLLTSAEDADAGVNSVQDYGLAPGTGASAVFRLVTARVGVVRQPRLELVSRLNRETRASYEMRYCARDGGRPIRSGCVGLLVRILDTNDNAPVIELSSLVRRVPESLSPGSVCGNVKASDQDSGANARLQFRLVSELMPRPLRTVFSLGAGSGELRLLRALSRIDHTGQILLPIVVADNGIPPLSSSATITITVLQTNNVAPAITVTPLGQDDVSMTPVLLENQPPGRVVAFVYVQDTDKGENGRFECSLSGPLSSFRLVMEGEIGGSGRVGQNEQEYRLESAETLDREERPLVDVTVACSDRGSPPLSSRRRVMVRVLDQNDNSPRFHPPGRLEVSVMENTPVHSLLARLNVSDADEAPPDSTVSVKCHLEPGGDNTALELDSDQCALFTKRRLDREASDRIEVRVTARDRAPPNRSATLTVLVRVLDQNDSPPEFGRSLYELHVTENQAAIVFGQLVAQDADLDENGRVSYRLSYHDNSAQIAFTIDEHSGNLRTRVQLDREQRSGYTFDVVAIDNGDPRLASTASVRVIVDDVNDNRPTFLYPSKDNRSHVFSLDNPRGTSLIKVTATDVDEGVNKEIVYEIIEGNKDGMFMMNLNTGQLYLDRNLDKRDKGTYTLTIEARDNGDISLSDTGILRLTFDWTIQPLPSYSGVIEADGHQATDGAEYPPSPGADDNGSESLLLGKNVVLVVCVIFVALLSVFVFVVMLYFLRRRQQMWSVAEGSSLSSPPLHYSHHDQPEMLGVKVAPGGPDSPAVLLTPHMQRQQQDFSNKLWPHLQIANIYTSQNPTSPSEEKYIPLTGCRPLYAIASTSSGDLCCMDNDAAIAQATSNYYESLVKPNEAALQTGKTLDCSQSTLDKRSLIKFPHDLQKTSSFSTVKAGSRKRATSKWWFSRLNIGSRRPRTSRHEQRNNISDNKPDPEKSFIVSMRPTANNNSNNSSNNNHKSSSLTRSCSSTRLDTTVGSAAIATTTVTFRSPALTAIHNHSISSPASSSRSRSATANTGSGCSSSFV